jgi:hypothetical protein
VPKRTSLTRPPHAKETARLVASRKQRLAGSKAPDDRVHLV